MIVWISGPTGAGKTSLTSLLSRAGFGVVQEKVPLSLLHAFADAPSLHCAALQEEIMHSRLETWQRISGRPSVVFDRSLDEDMHVFCEMHFRLGFLSEMELRRLHESALELNRHLPSPDLIVFLCPSNDVLRKRIAKDTHPFVISNNLELQLLLYREWINSRKEEVLVVDNSKCELSTLSALLGVRGE
jgi:deoxyadenosine/deoxycytidine kinase